jgi:predicted nucleic acid-binding Zn ribbon protein
MSAPRVLPDVECELCGILFRPFCAGRKFCSQNCADERKRRVDIAQLSKLVFSGETKAAIARQLGVSYATVRRNVSEYGLQAAWREQRYA